MPSLSLDILWCETNYRMKGCGANVRSENVREIILRRKKNTSDEVKVIEKKGQGERLVCENTWRKLKLWKQMQSIESHGKNFHVP